MTTCSADNVHCAAVEGTFDDCQRIVKSLLSDQELQSEISLTSINSINWCRIMCQIVYYWYAAFRVLDALEGDATEAATRVGDCNEESTLRVPSVSFCTPTGNFGNILVCAHMAAPTSTYIYIHTHTHTYTSHITTPTGRCAHT
eukprot:GHVU01080162.1.p1 GENE.GHVU01080162.1~~GHVU01080162.1.p1  ORF type:complete len:154 (+),score=11.22 GHVU01080162.1:31-462(+)